VSHIVDTCPLTGGLSQLYSAYDDAVVWMHTTTTTTKQYKYVLE